MLSFYDENTKMAMCGCVLYAESYASLTLYHVFILIIH